LSQEACAWLSEAGYTGLVENSEGFVGWKKYGLPWKKAGSNSIF
jgi:rhodanese-related sulfurtransferase